MITRVSRFCLFAFITLAQIVAACGRLHAQATTLRSILTSNRWDVVEDPLNPPMGDSSLLVFYATPLDSPRSAPQRRYAWGVYFKADSTFRMWGRGCYSPNAKPPSGTWTLDRGLVTMHVAPDVTYYMRIVRIKPTLLATRFWVKAPRYAR